MKKLSSDTIKERNERYNKYVNAVTPQTSLLKALLKSFFVGGFTCVVGQGIYELYTLAFPNLSSQMISGFMLCTIIIVAIFLTGIGVFDRLGRFAGAGAFLPITGFANAMASASMEHKSEGLILGSQTKFFSVVGPVLVNGVVWSSVAGIIHWIIILITG